MWCFHDRLTQHTFRDGVTIKCCVDCRSFDSQRIEALRVNNVEMPHSEEEFHWQFVLEQAGLSEYVGDMPWQYNVGTLQDLANVPHAHVIPDHLPHTVPMWESWITTTQPLLKGLYNQRRIDAAKRYTVLDDNEHVDRAKPFPHTGTMPRALHNFCPRCSTYATADHDGCEGNNLEPISKMREQEHNRQLRNATITLSDPTTLTPSQILIKKGGYGKD